MSVLVQTAGLLVCSNVFMTFAWYAHLRNLRTAPWLVAVGISWGIAFFEYLLQVPANRIGYTTLQLSQLKVMQEAITRAMPDGSGVLRLPRMTPIAPSSHPGGERTAIE